MIWVDQGMNGLFGIGTKPANTLSNPDTGSGSVRESRIGTGIRTTGARRIDFKIWRYHQGWNRYLMRWRVRLSDRSYLRDRSRAAPGTADWLVDAFSDDGHHSEEAIMTTLRSVAPHLSESISLLRICVYPFTYLTGTPHTWDPTIAPP